MAPRKKEKSSPQPSGEASSSKEEGEEGCHRWSCRSVDASKVYEFDEELISLKKVLLTPGSESGLKAIGIIGMAGIGKTTLCQLVFNEKQVKDLFLPRIWVCMSRIKPDDNKDEKVEILKRMLVSLGVEEAIINKVYEGHNLTGLLSALHLLLAGKRYLIVFDDASWDARELSGIKGFYGQLNSSQSPSREGKWDRLAYGLPKGCGGAVIVTSRNEALAKMMVGGQGIVYRVQPRPDPESCWSIFKDAAAAANRKLSQSEAGDLKKDIFEKSAGIPLAAKMMAKNLESSTVETPRE